MSSDLWIKCIEILQDELSSQQFNTWIMPLKVIGDEQDLCILAPNKYVSNWVKEKFLTRIEEVIDELSQGESPAIALTSTNRRPNSINSIQIKKNSISFEDKKKNDILLDKQQAIENIKRKSVENCSYNRQEKNRNSEEFQHYVGNKKNDKKIDFERDNNLLDKTIVSKKDIQVEGSIRHKSSLNNQFKFGSFVEGKSNQLALAASLQVSQNPGSSYNPLFLYGGVGLGKTHLMQAVGNALVEKNPSAKVVYLHSERFVADMVKALQLNAINHFKRFYRSVDALLIDDIQFFSGKERSQEEFFHTFNALLEGGQQMILTCDRYPKEINGLEERLKSRFGWGLTVAVEPPELETRVAILMKKAEQYSIKLPHDSAFFIAKKIRSNVRELEGALKRVVANAHFMNRKIDINFIRESLKDLLALQDKQVSIDNIQKTISEYYKIKMSDILSKRRNRSVARPRQVAMALAKELTNHSLPEIGDSFGGRDHTTVLHACRKIKDLQRTDTDIREDYKNLLRLLTH